EELFHDANLAWLIADLNQQSIKETWEGNKRVIELRTRQQLELPVWQDIVEFYQSRPANSSPESLVTVVTNTRLDQELIDSTLGAVIGCAIPQSLLHKPT
ncbi:MAG: hypothetical protein HY711_06860, partial [Candidatus Melainabacteria bacterium]|nr:hypothetical protein [Candidatus Melainabacteria bacterium]